MRQDGSPDETVPASAEDPDWLPPEINTGVVPMQAWRPDGGAMADPRGPTSYAAMGRKP